MAQFPILQAKLKRFEEIERMLVDPEILADSQKSMALQKEHGGLGKVARSVKQFNDLTEAVENAKTLLNEESDPEMREMAQSELNELLPKHKVLETELEDILTAGDAATRGALIMEIRAGTGGEEAALFARDLLGMYMAYVETKGWKTEVLELSEAEMGGIKEVTFSVTGEGAFMDLQFESGGHRVQRVPETETQGRVHTSAATVAVLPEATEVEIDIKDEDLKIDTMRAGGPGGQKVNKTESAVRITHLPSGIVVRIQDEKSQHKNKAKAMRVLRSRLLEKTQEEVHNARADHRRTLVGSGGRNERIRTYNFPQNRITDHRIGLTLHRLDTVIQGELGEIIKALRDFDRNERLNATEEAPVA
ncbi:MAG: peptide chain release factor 1 [Planctomycetaceae bacterium]|nr:peptide chain release factor 1 [Planctomycetaceae bacterium]